MLQEAAKLAKDGELGNSDAIRLLQIPHSTAEVQEVLRKFEKHLSREANSKLALDAFVPLPENVDNQRFEPLFEKYLITGKTYTTTSGTVVPNEIQYYNGEMVHLYGECANLALVGEEMAGSGYKAVTLKHADGRQTAIVQVWANKLSDTSLRPYNSMFIVISAVPEDAPAEQASFIADENGASSVLSMLHGTYDAAKGVYENAACLYFVRLYDSTRIAIEVGRERMGTDKRPGTTDLKREGRLIAFSILDKDGHAMAKGNVLLAEDPMAYLPEVAKAASSARIPFGSLPPGTEYVFPAVARIGAGPIASWQWRTDLVPRLQAVKSDSVRFDASSEEGDMLIKWGFTPKVLGYIPNVRGAITGLAENSSSDPVGDTRASGLSFSPAPTIRTHNGAPARNSSPVPWTDEQWYGIRQAVNEVGRKARVAASFLPIVDPPAPDRDYVAKSTLSYQALPPGAPSPKEGITVADDETQSLLTLEVRFNLSNTQITDPELSSALQLFRHAANVLTRLEDSIIFNGRKGELPASGHKDLGKIWTIHPNMNEDRGLFKNGATKECPAEIVLVDNRGRYGRGLVSGISAAIGQLEAGGHFGPFACVLGQDFFRDVQTPNESSLVLPQDRILPLLGGGPLLRSSRLDKKTGVVVALSGAPVDLVMSKDFSVEFLQVTSEAKFAFRLYEKLALRVKESTAIVALST